MTGGEENEMNVLTDNSFDPVQSIIDAANKYGVDPDFALRIAHQESGINPKVRDSSAGAIGTMQLMPDTAKDLGVDPRDPAQNIDGGVRYLKQLQDQFGADTRVVAGAYNAGPGRMRSALAGRAELPVETSNYIASVSGSPISAKGLGYSSAPPEPQNAPVKVAAAAPAANNDDGWVDVPQTAAPAPKEDDGWVDVPQPRAAASAAVNDWITPPDDHLQSSTSAASFKDRFNALARTPGGDDDWIDVPNTAPASAAEPSVAMDVAKQLGSGVVAGVANIPSAPARIARLTATLLDSGLTKLFPDSQYVKDMVDRDNKSFAAADALRKQGPFLENVLPAPETTAGQYARTIGEFAPAAAAGPGSVVRRAAQTVVPAVASETAGQATAGTDWETAARIAGALAGGVGENAVGRGAPKIPLPSADDLRDAARANYKQVQDMGVTIRPAPVANLSTKIESDLTDKGLTERNVPETYGVIRTLQNPPTGSVMRAQDFENARQELVQARANVANPREAVAANHAITALDDYLSNIPHGDVLSGDARAASQLYDTARQNWAAASRLDMVNGKIDLGELNAATANAGANIDNATRQAVKQLIRPNNKGTTLAERSGFNQDEIDQMNTVARGTPVGNFVRYAGKLGPNGAVSSFLHGDLALKTGGATIPLSVAAKIAQWIGDRSTLNGANKLADTVAARSPLARSAVPAAAAPGLTANDMAVIAGLLAAPRSQ